MKKKYLLNILKKIHNSEKSTNLLENYNTYVIQVENKAKKKNIRDAVKKIFNVKHVRINTTLVKKSKKIKNYKKKYVFKKAYISIKSKEKLNFN